MSDRSTSRRTRTSGGGPPRDEGAQDGRQRPNLAGTPSRDNRNASRTSRGGPVNDSSYHGLDTRPSLARQGAQRGRTSSQHSVGGVQSVGGDGRESQYRQVSGQRDNSRIKAELDARIRCPARRIAGNIVDNVYVKVTILFFIIANAITMGVATFDFVTENPHLQHIFELVDFAFLILFTAELCCQWLYRGFTLWKDGWLIFDFIIIVLSWAFESLQVVRAFRIFRALRLIGQLGPLRQLVLAIGTTLPRLHSIGYLLLLDVYVFAVLFTELWGEEEDDDLPVYFETLPKSAFTCIEMMTLEDWGGVARALTINGYWYAQFIISIFMVLTGFIVFNLIVAVVCDAVYMIHEHIRWLDGKEEDSESDFMDAILAEEEIPERMVALTNKFRLMVEYQMHLERMVDQLVAHMREMDLLDEDFRPVKYEIVHNLNDDKDNKKSKKPQKTQEEGQRRSLKQQPPNNARSLIDAPKMQMSFDDDQSSR